VLCESQKRNRSESSAKSIPEPKGRKIGSGSSTKSFPVSNKGQKPDGLLALLAVRGETDNGKPTWSCIASSCNYGPVKGNLQREHVLKHAMKCKHLQKHDSHAFEEAVLVSKEGSLGAQLGDGNADVALQTLTKENSFGNSGSGLMGTSASHVVSFSNAVPSNIVTGDGRLNRDILVASGQKLKEERRKKFNLEVNHALMQLICICSLVPNILDSPQWEKFVTTLGGGWYKRTGSDEFHNKFIPQEAVYVRDLQIKLLKAEENLTLTFDGTTIRKPESFYTAHATTPSRQSYFLDGHEGTGEHHDMAWIMDKLLTVHYSKKLEYLNLHLLHGNNILDNWISWHWKMGCNSVCWHQCHKGGMSRDSQERSRPAWYLWLCTSHPTHNQGYYKTRGIQERESESLDHYLYRNWARTISFFRWWRACSNILASQALQWLSFERLWKQWWCMSSSKPSKKLARLSLVQTGRHV